MEQTIITKTEVANRYYEIEQQQQTFNNKKMPSSKYEGIFNWALSFST